MPRRARFEPDRSDREDRPIYQDAGRPVRKRSEGRGPQARTCCEPAQLVAVDGTLRRDEHDELPAVALEAGGAHTRAGRLVDSGGELLDATLCAGLAQKRGNTFNRFGPHELTQ